MRRCTPSSARTSSGIASRKRPCTSALSRNGTVTPPPRSPLEQREQQQRHPGDQHTGDDTAMNQRQRIVGEPRAPHTVESGPPSTTKKSGVGGKGLGSSCSLHALAKVDENPFGPIDANQSDARKLEDRRSRTSSAERIMANIVLDETSAAPCWCALVRRARRRRGTGPRGTGRPPSGG